MHEVAAVARAKGLTVPDDTVETLIQRARGAEGLGLPSSMMFDCLGGKAMEVEVGWGLLGLGRGAGKAGEARMRGERGGGAEEEGRDRTEQS